MLLRRQCQPRAGGGEYAYGIDSESLNIAASEPGHFDAAHDRAL